MSLQDELAPKVAEIERLAREMYDERLYSFGLKVGEGGTLVEDPEAPLPMHPVDREQEQQYYNEFVSYLGTVTSRFELYYDLDTMELLDLTSKIGGMADYSGYGSPYTVYDRIDNADDNWIRPVLGMIDAEEWSGTAATTFYNDFLLPFHDAAEQQQACTRVLGMVAMCGYKGVIKAEDDLLAIADLAIAAFSGQRETDWAGSLGVASIMAGVVGLFLPTGATQVAGVVSIGAGIASMFAATDDSGDERTVDIKAINAPMGLESLWDALMAFEDELERKDQQMSEPLETDLNSRQAFASPDLRLAEPGIEAPGDFGRHEVGTVVDGVPLAEQESVVTAVALYEAGSRNLPSAAYQLEQATSHLTDTMPPSFSKLFYRTASTFQQARAQLRGAVSAIRWDLENTGPILVDVAKNYEATDEENAEIQRQIERVLPPVDSEPTYPPYY